MKQKSNWLKELGMSVLFLGVFALIRFILAAQGVNLRIGDEVIAVVIVSVTVIIAVLISLTGKLKNLFSFSHDALIISIVGYFLWSLNGNAEYLIILSVGIFALLTISSTISTIKLFKTAKPSAEQTKELIELHDFISYCLGPKFIVVALGAILIEKLLVPLVAA